MKSQLFDLVKRAFLVHVPFCKEERLELFAKAFNFMLLRISSLLRDKSDTSEKLRGLLPLKVVVELDLPISSSVYEEVLLGLVSQRRVPVSDLGLLLRKVEGDLELLRFLVVNNQLGLTSLIYVEDYAVQNQVFNWWLSHGRSAVYPSINLFTLLVDRVFVGNLNEPNDPFFQMSNGFLERNKKLFFSLFLEKISSGGILELLFNFLSSIVPVEVVRSYFARDFVFEGISSVKVFADEVKKYDYVEHFLREVEDGMLYLSTRFDYHSIQNYREVERLKLLRLVDRVEVDCEFDLDSDDLSKFLEKVRSLKIPVVLRLSLSPDLKLEKVTSFMKLAQTFGTSLYFEVDAQLDLEKVYEVFKVWLDDYLSVKIYPFSELFYFVVGKLLGIEEKTSVLWQESPPVSFLVKDVEQKVLEVVYCGLRE